MHDDMMATEDSHSAPAIADPGSEVSRLRETLVRMEQQQDRLARARRRDLLTVGVGVSVIVHLCLLWLLATQYRITPGPPGTEPVSYEFAIVQEEELTELALADLEDLLPEVVEPTSDPAEAAGELEPAAAALQLVQAGSMPTLGGPGGGGDIGSLAGGGAGATFFGVSSRGTRFAYIVDRSGSMGQGRKMHVAMRELTGSVGTLPDYASFYVVLFSSGFVEPPMQRGWMRARRSTVNRLINWLNETDPGGGTEPVPAFQLVFALDVRPDVIFFLTDGEIPENTADLVASLNERGGRVIINTIAFGDDRSQDQLRRIARESGGMYRFVRQEGG